MTFDKQSIRRAIWWLFIALFLAAGYVIRDGYFDPILASTAVIVDKMEEQRDNNDELMNYENLTARASHVSYRQYQVGESIEVTYKKPYLSKIFLKDTEILTMKPVELQKSS
ncbi:hypothetical protein LOK74_20925 [Brevibacillus humidisoli]|uniref:hypothetical protein n=1 Tax=Brevibacillus humidisoli TaxID=2895522 RepID=UPI001E40FC00|nr:hypothetical protein [Brevibacillus humidisoli]UFJ40466.1 hypothetical protein LOK74_20925 [Brevibacillus humidisoli]